MQRTSGSRWLLVLAVLAVMAATVRLARPQFESWTRERLTRHYQSEVAALPESGAAQLIRRLSQDEQWLDVIVAAAADARPGVASAGRAALLDRVERWAQLPPGDSSPRVAELAGLLAEHAPRLPPEQMLFAQSLTHRLLIWPIDGRTIDTAALIAHCQAVLDLPADEPPALELAAAPRVAPPSAPPAAPPAEPPALAPIVSPPTPPERPATAPQPSAPVEDSPAIQQEPRRFTVPPRGARISDE